MNKSQAKEIPYKKINKYIDQPFQLALIGRKGVGKSTELIRYLTDPDWFYGLADFAVVINPSINNDDKYKQVIFDKVYGSKELNDRDFESILKEVINTAEHLFKTHNRTTLLVLDDVVNYMPSSAQNQGEIRRLFTMGRHLGILTVICSQYFKGLPASVRKNLDALVLFHTSNNKEKEAIYEEYGLTKKKHDFFRLFENALPVKAERNRLLLNVDRGGEAYILKNDHSDEVIDIHEYDE